MPSPTPLTILELYLQAQALLSSQVPSCPTNVLEVKLEDRFTSEGRRHIHLTTIQVAEKEAEIAMLQDKAPTEITTPSVVQAAPEAAEKPKQFKAPKVSSIRKAVEAPTAPATLIVAPVTPSKW
jgi:hypothetical protein